MRWVTALYDARLRVSVQIRTRPMQHLHTRMGVRAAHSCRHCSPRPTQPPYACKRLMQTMLPALDRTFGTTDPCPGLAPAMSPLASAMPPAGPTLLEAILKSCMTGALASTDAM